MPVYEFYCPDCHRIFNFLARRPDVTAQPACPRCNRPKLERRISPFAVAKTGHSATEGDDIGLPPGMDEEKVERAIEEMATETEGLDEEDPRQVARMMRKLCDKTGLRLGDGMEEAIRRLETGEDPEVIEQQMGDLLDNEDMPFQAKTSKATPAVQRTRPPDVDPELYEL